MNTCSLFLVLTNWLRCMRFRLAAVGKLDATIDATLRNAQQLAVDGLRGGVEEAVAFVQRVNTTINAIQDATQVPATPSPPCFGT
jgi:hypothetical protein